MGKDEGVETGTVKGLGEVWVARQCGDWDCKGFR